MLLKDLLFSHTTGERKRNVDNYPYRETGRQHKDEEPPSIPLPRPGRRYDILLGRLSWALGRLKPQAFADGVWTGRLSELAPDEAEVRAHEPQRLSEIVFVKFDFRELDPWPASPPPVSWLWWRSQTAQEVPCALSVHAHLAELRLGASANISPSTPLASSGAMKSGADGNSAALVSATRATTATRGAARSARRSTGPRRAADSFSAVMMGACSRKKTKLLPCGAPGTRADGGAVKAYSWKRPETTKAAAAPNAAGQPCARSGRKTERPKRRCTFEKCPPS